MAGRGRGRGRGFTFDIGAIGFGRGDALPTTIQQPPPIFPPQEKKPLPLRVSDADDYMLALKQEFKGCMKESPYFLKPNVIAKDIERYSDRYREKQHDEPAIEWEPDWQFFPSELKIKVRRRKVHSSARPVIPSGQAGSNTSGIFEQLEELVAKEGNAEKENPTQGEQGGSEESGEEEEEYDEEEQEEENDYLVSHFDDDDEYGYADDDDKDEGPIY